MRMYEFLKEMKKNLKDFTCRWCKEKFESEFGKFCPHCHRFQDFVSTNVGKTNETL